MVSVSHPLLTRFSHFDSTRQLKLNAYCQMANMSQWITYVSQIVLNNTCESSVKWPILVKFVQVAHWINIISLNLIIVCEIGHVSEHAKMFCLINKITYMCGRDLVVFEMS
jgi:hypothetical protein